MCSVTNLAYLKHTNIFTEPISGTAPNVALVLKFIRYVVPIGENVALLCPAQAFPVPNYRWVQLAFFCIFSLRRI